jgi:hypothetical protein
MSTPTSKIIALDASFIEKQNFLRGNKLRELGKLAAAGEIELLITDVVYKEILIRFKQRLIDADINLKKNRKAIDSQCMVLKNFSAYDVLFVAYETDVDRLDAQFREEFDTFLTNCRVQVVKTEALSVGPIMSDYFSRVPPFQRESKKHEFPDAVTLKGLEAHLSSRREKSTCYLVSGDGDLLAYQSSSVTVIEDPTGFIDHFIRSSQRKALIKEIENYFDEMEDLLKTQIAEQVEEEVSDGMWSSSNYNVEYVDDVNVEDVDFHNRSLIYMNSGRAKMEVLTSMSLAALVEYEDYSMASYDSEDNHWYNVQQGHADVDQTVQTTITLEFEYDENSGRVKSMDIDDLGDYLRQIELE